MLRKGIFAFVFIAGGVLGATIQVPGDQSTIQAGIDAVAAGDTVLVASGTYRGAANKNLDFGGIDRVLRSQAGADSTVIDCEGEGRGLYLHRGESVASVIEGFTIENGSVSDDGGGIHLASCSPTLRKCTVRGNVAIQKGGGIYCSSADPTLSECVLSGNAADQGGGLYGTYADPSVTDCEITDNTSSDYGGGIYGYYLQMVMSGSSVKGNVADSYGGGLYCNQSDAQLIDCTITENSGRSGGGMYCFGGASTLENCSVTDNLGTGGGGLYWVAAEGALTGCTISGNEGASFGGGVVCVNCSPSVTECRISENEAGSQGGGVYCAEASPVVVQCTISENQGTYGGGVYCTGSSSPSLTGCVIQANSSTTVWGNGGGSTVEKRPAPFWTIVPSSRMWRSDQEVGSTARSPPGRSSAHVRSRTTPPTAKEEASIAKMAGSNFATVR